MNYHSVVYEQTDIFRNVIYTIYHESRGCVGFVAVRPDDSREYRDRTGRLIPKAPADASASAWDQAVDEYTKRKVDA